LSAPDYAARILLVDDEPAYGELIGRALPEYHLDYAESYDEALDRLKAGLRYDVAIVDLNLIGRKFKDQLGKKVLAHLLANYPSTRRIAMTGASPGSVSEIFKKFQVDDLLFKQHLDLDDVGVVVEAALARASGAVPPEVRTEQFKLWDRLHKFKQKQLRRFDARLERLEIDIRDAGHRGTTGPEWSHPLAELEAAKADLEVIRASFDGACAAVAKAIAGVASDDTLIMASRELDELMSHFGTVADVRGP
jgi:CheY-like chemotaxis protein